MTGPVAEKNILESMYRKLVAAYSEYNHCKKDQPAFFSEMFPNEKKKKKIKRYPGKLVTGVIHSLVEISGMLTVQPEKELSIDLL
jgi:hypothetical protein